MGIKASDYWETTVTSPRIEWSEVKDRMPLEMVATNLLGPAHQRKGKRLLWPCPFHDDHDPSFQVADPTGLQVLKKCRVSGRRHFCHPTSFQGGGCENGRSTEDPASGS